jgi:RNA polymerase sigma factor (sigma-70 family)
MSRFQTTRWSLILAAREAPELARPALEQLCRIYRPPVVAYVRRSGYPPADVDDLTQAFFLRFLERGWHAHADPGRGRFRSLLLTALRHFLDDQRAQSMALKRGGTLAHDNAPEDLVDPDETPEQAFTRAWLGTVLARAMTSLQGEWERAGKQAQFEQLVPLLAEHAAGDNLRTLAQATGVRANTIAVQAHRMRQRLRQLVRLELLHTVGTAEAVDDELAELRGALEEAV